MRMLKVSAISDRKRCHVACAPHNRRAEHDCDQEKGEHRLDHESGRGCDGKGDATESEVMSKCWCAGAGNATAQNNPQQQRAGYAAKELTDDMASGSGRIHRASGKHADSHGRIHMAV
jgi:hypothetical protein